MCNANPDHRFLCGAVRVFVGLPPGDKDSDRGADVRADVAAAAYSEMARLLIGAFQRVEIGLEQEM